MATTTNSTFYYYNPTTGVTSSSISSDATLTPSSYLVPSGSNLIEVIIGDNVTDLSGSCFSGQTSLAAVSIGSSVTNLGSTTFNQCTALTSISIPSNVQTLGEYCFSNNGSLVSVTMYGVVTITDACFYNCPGLTSIIIPSTVTTLGSNAFGNCSTLVSLTYAEPGNITVYDSSVFLGTSTSLIVDFYNTASISGTGIYSSSLYPSGAQLIPVNSLFSSASSTTIFVYYSTYSSNTYSYETVYATTTLTSSSYLIPSGCNLIGVTIGDTITDLSGSCFSGQTSLATVDLTNVQTLGYATFNACTSLTSISIPASVTSFGEYCFANNSSLVSVNMQYSGLNTIFQACFYSCSGLTSITIPSTVTTIESNAFGNCSSLAVLSYDNPQPINISDSSIFVGTPSNIVVNFYQTNPSSVPTTGVYALSLYSNPYPNYINGTNGGTITTYIYSSNTTTDISSNTTTDISLNSTSFTIPSGYSLTEVYIGDAVTGLNNNCFENDASLSTVYIGNSVTSLGDYCFAGCSSLTSIILPPSVTTLNYYCFSGCEALASVTMSGVTTILADAFVGCYDLTSITIPSSVYYLDSYAFYSCVGLKSVIYANPGGITVVGSDIFTGSTPAVSVQFYNTNPSSVPTTGVYSSALYPEGSTTSYYSTTSCYNEETLVLILKNGVEKYVKIEDLRKGNLVKTHLHGYKPIEMIGKNKIINSKHNRLNSMYKINDLIVTGGHYILVDDLSGNKLPNTHSQFYELNLKIDNKHCLLACDYVNAKRIIDNNVYDIYHLVLEGKSESYGIYVNGLLSESTSKEHFIKQKFTLLNDN